MNSKPLFMGLSHLGQVFSIGWAMKNSSCSVYDMNAKNLKSYKLQQFTAEEPSLKKAFLKVKKKIKICKSIEEVKNHKIIFFTLDTPLNSKGEPDFLNIEKNIVNLIKKLKNNSHLIICSQVYCGFTDKIKKLSLKLNKKINISYMAETLKMGVALERFLNPEQLIFGTNNNDMILKLFNKYKCPIFTLSYKEAEVIKMAINLYLMTSVTYANGIENFCRENNFQYQNIIKVLRNDKRIGKYSYIEPSLGIGGGHLERDHETIIRNTKDKLTKKLFINMKKHNENRINILFEKIKKIQKIVKINKILWIGASYKSESYSLVNSTFLKVVNKIKNKISINVYDSYYKIEESKKYKIINNLREFNFNNICIIYNYSDAKDFNLIKKNLNYNKSKLIDLTNNYKRIENKIIGIFQ